MYKNIDLEKIISTIIVEEFIVLTLLDERFFIPIDGLNSLVFEKNNIYINGTDDLNFIIHGNSELLDSYKDQLLNEGDEFEEKEQSMRDELNRQFKAEMERKYSGNDGNA